MLNTEYTSILSLSCLQPFLLIFLSLSGLAVSDEGNSTACTLCQDGRLPLPFPLREVFPENTCIALQIDAGRNTPQMCPYYQGVIGYRKLLWL